MKRLLLIWALVSTLTASVAVYEAIRCRSESPPPPDVKSDIIGKDRVPEGPRFSQPMRKAPKKPTTTRLPEPAPFDPCKDDPWEPGQPHGHNYQREKCEDWTDAHGRFTFLQKERELLVEQNFELTISPGRKTATLEELSPKTGEVLKTYPVALPDLTHRPPLPKFRIDLGAYIEAEQSGWFARGTYRPSRFTFVSLTAGGDTRLEGGLSIEF